MNYPALSVNDLVSACTQSSDEFAWAEFVRRFHPLIASVTLRVARQWGERAPHVIDDLIQETYLKLCASGLRSFRATRTDRPDAIYAYVKVFTANLAHDQLKAAKAQKRGGSVDTSSDGGEIDGTGRVMPTRTESVIERRLLLQEVESCLTAVTPGSKSERDRRIFWLYYRVGLSANAIAHLPTIDLTTKGVESTILRLTRLVRKQLGEPRQRGTPNIGPTKGMSTENSF